MSTSIPEKEILKKLSNRMIKFHLKLLEIQISNSEQKLARKFTPPERFQLVMLDPEYQWLRILSQSIVAVDELEEQKTQITGQQLVEMKSKLFDLFQGQVQENFTKGLENSLQFKPELKSELDEIISLVGELQIQ